MAASITHPPLVRGGGGVIVIEVVEFMLHIDSCLKKGTLNVRS